VAVVECCVWRFEKPKNRRSQFNPPSPNFQEALGNLRTHPISQAQLPRTTHLVPSTAAAHGYLAYASASVAVHHHPDRLDICSLLVVPPCLRSLASQPTTQPTFATGLEREERKRVGIFWRERVWEPENTIRAEASQPEILPGLLSKHQPPSLTSEHSRLELGPPSPAVQSEPVGYTDSLR